jgi:hypothetical protein
MDQGTQKLVRRNEWQNLSQRRNVDQVERVHSKPSEGSGRSEQENLATGYGKDCEFGFQTREVQRSGEENHRFDRDNSRKSKRGEVKFKFDLERVRGVRKVEGQESEGFGRDDKEEGKRLDAKGQIGECFAGEFEINRDCFLINAGSSQEVCRFHHEH